MKTHDIVIIGGGIMGCSLARVLSLRYPDQDIVVLEKEQQVARHTSGRNSGVIHSGINLEPGSLKAELCVRGNRMLREYCKDKGVPMEEVGTVVLAREPEEVEVLESLKQRADANGVPNVRIMDIKEARRIEPYASGVAALHAPTGGIVDPKALVEQIAKEAEAHGVGFMFGTKIGRIEERGAAVEAHTTGGALKSRFLINCAGLYADKLAQTVGVGEEYTIVPFRGDYFRLTSEKSHLVRSMIYPPPDFDVPFLGVHFTKTISGDVLLGPNAALSLGRESYSYSDLNPSEAVEILGDEGFLRLVFDPDFLSVALREVRISLFRHIFLREAQTLVPVIGLKDLERDRSGNRAQLVDRRGNLVSDFVIRYTEHTAHILNAVSPGLTSSLAFAEMVAGGLSDRISLPPERTL